MAWSCADGHAAGDPFRHRLDLQGKRRPQCSAYNHRERSVTANLQSTGGREVVRRLEQSADVFVEDFYAGTLDSIGSGREVLHGLSPRLIYCSITGMATSGPVFDRPTYDATAQAVSGL